MGTLSQIEPSKHTFGLWIALPHFFLRTRALSHARKDCSRAVGLLLPPPPSQLTAPGQHSGHSPVSCPGRVDV